MVPIFALQKTSLQDFPGKISAIVFLAGCNFRCVFCHNPAAVAGKGTVSEADFFSFLDSRKGKLQGVVVSGGEPVIHFDLPEFLSKIKSKGFLVKLDTNGSNPSMLRELFQKNLLDYVAMDVKAPFSKYRSITGAKNMAPKIKQSIRLVMDSGIDYEFRTTCHPSLFKKDFLEIAKQIRGCRRLFLQPYVDTVTLNPQKHLAIYNQKALQSLCDELKPFAKEIGLR